MSDSEVRSCWAFLGLSRGSHRFGGDYRRGPRRRSAQRYPWNLEEVSKLHVAIVGTLAGFAFTGVVLVATLGRDTAQRAAVALDTVIVMFLVAYFVLDRQRLSLSYLPRALGSGDLLQRVHFSLASTLISYRFPFLVCVAAAAPGERPRPAGPGALLPSTGFAVSRSLLLAMATDGLGLVLFKEHISSRR